MTTSMALQVRARAEIHRASALALCVSALGVTACGEESQPSRQSGVTAASSGAGAGGSGPTYPDPYTRTVLDGARINSHTEQRNYQHATGELELTDAPFASVKMVVDLASTCSPLESWVGQPPPVGPPAGENWPADCDAFDRNFEVVLDEPAEPAVGPPGLELLHAITPFGGPEHVELDITDIANGLPGKHAVGVSIPTYSDTAGQVSGSNGGWNVTVRIEVTPGPAPRDVLAVLPLFRGVQTSAMSPAPIDFELPAGTTETRVEYRTSGHGGGAVGPGCIGPAEEFCHRKHVIQLDGAELETVDPWRTDCEKLCTIAHYDGPSGGFDYCEENPCGAISSVQASRANWCPGSVTPAYTWTPDALRAPGTHSFGWQISTVVMNAYSGTPPTAERRASAKLAER